MGNTRRDFLKKSTLLAFGTLLMGNLKKVSAITAKNQLYFSGKHTVPQLSYDYSALEPYIDRQTMELHHSKHHVAYVEKLNKALEPFGYNTPLEEMFSSISHYPESVRNNGGGHYNHSLFWELMTPKGSEEPKGKLAEEIQKQFGNFFELKKQFQEAALRHFGSGWTWLIVTNEKTLRITTTDNQDNPLMNCVSLQGKPVLALDLWEHAYYLKHQNKRADYIAAWWNVVNWNKAENLFAEAMK